MSAATGAGDLAPAGLPGAVEAPRAEVGVALLGCGTVGSEVVRLLGLGADELAGRVGARLALRGVAVRRRDVDRPGVDPALLTTDAQELVARDDVDVVVEVMGGVEPARSLLLSAVGRGAAVVSANKALLAEHGPQLHAAAGAAGVPLLYEASVAGAIPLLRPLRESLAGDRVSRVVGIVNGTTNFVLSAMTSSGASFADALAEATALGYAEADPTADVEGFDAAAKTAILASLAFHCVVTAADVHREGITGVTARDVVSAADTGCVVKALAIAERLDDGSVGVRTHPAMLPRSHPLASVDGAYNAVVVEAESAGRLMFYGPGAGGSPTASAVLGDLVAAASDVVRGPRTARAGVDAALPVSGVGEARTRYHLSLHVADRPGVLAQVAGAFAAREVSIATVRQEGSGEDASLVLVTHRARDADLRDTVEDLRALPSVRAVTSVLRVEGDDA